MATIEVWECEPLTLELHYDEMADNPRKDGRDHLGTMVCWHRQADLGDETVNTEHYDSMTALIEEYAGKDGYVQPLYLYEHSGMTIRTGTGGNPFTCQWDSGQVGFIFTTPERIAEWYPHPRYDCSMEGCDFYLWGSDSIAKDRVQMALHLYEHLGEGIHAFHEVSPEQMIVECFDAEVEEYDQYLRGDVYGYVIKDDRGETYDSCWGFFGLDYATEQAKEALDTEWKHLTEQRTEAARHASLVSTEQFA